MVNPIGSKQLPLRPKLVQRLLQRWKQETQSKASETHPKFGGYVNDMLERVLAKYEFMARYMPQYCFVGFSDNVMLIKDSNINRIVEVILKRGRLHCQHDDSHNCDHVIFALAVPDVAKLDFDKEQQPNSISDKLKMLTMVFAAVSLARVFCLVLQFALPGHPVYPF